MTDDEDYRQGGSGDGVDIESEIEMEFNKFIELSWVSTEIILSSKWHPRVMWGASSLWSFDTNSEWGSIKTTIIGKTQPPL